MPKISFSSVIVFSFAAVTFFIIGKHINSRKDPALSPIFSENEEYYLNSVNHRSIPPDIKKEIYSGGSKSSRPNNSPQKYNNTTKSINLGTVNKISNGLNYLPITHLQYQNVTECGCLRPFFYPTPDNGTKRLNSTCSDEGSLYQKGQNVITMSMYFKTPKSSLRKMYTEGLQVNLQSIKSFYPGHTFRLYTDVKLDGEFCNIYCKNPALLWCDIKKTPELGDQSEMFFMSWRFLTLGDPSVDYFLSRDLDSAIIEREVAVVRDWLQNSNKAFHLMRDKHKAHNIPILGGMWGGSNSRLGYDVASDLRKKIIQSSKSDKRHKVKSGDQFTLNEIIFYPRKKDVVAYDCCHCTSWKKHTEVRAFPMQRANNINAFVGNYNLGRKNYTLAKCPVECRPNYGKDWEWC